MNLENIIKQLKMENDLTYFHNGKIDKPRYSKNKNVLKIQFYLDHVLPYQIYCILKDRFMKYLKCSIEIQIETKDTSCNEKELMNYILEIMSNHHYSFHIELKDGKIKLDKDKQSEYEHIQECLKQFGIVTEFIESETQVFEEVKTVTGPKRTNEV